MQITSQLHHILLGLFITCSTVIRSAVLSYTVQFSEKKKKKKKVFDVQCVLFSLPLLSKLFLSLKIILRDINLLKVSVLIQF